MPQKSQVAVYKTFLWSLIDNGSPVTNFYTVQSRVSNNRAIQDLSREKIYQELRIKSLKSRRWYRRIRCMFKIIKEEEPNYQIKLIPKSKPTIRTRSNHIPSYS